MINVKFQEQKIEMLIKKRGKDFTFTRFNKNEFGEVTKEIKTTVTFKGVFHISNKANIGSYVQVFNEDATRREAGKQYAILTTFTRYKDNPVEIDDIVEVEGKKYKVMASYNIDSANYGVEVSLEDIL